MSRTDTTNAIAEGRRVYFGSIPYMARKEDIEAFTGAYSSTNVVLSVDPFTSRNPGYCFVDFPSAELAARVIEELSGQPLMGRTVKIALGVKTERKFGQQNGETRQNGDFRQNNGENRQQGEYRQNGNQERSPPNGQDGQPFKFDRWTRNDAPEHFNNAAVQKRVFVGNLPSFDLDPPTVQTEIGNFFEGFNVEAISKIIVPNVAPVNNPEGGPRHFVFVDLADSQEAERAINELNGKTAWDRRIDVRPAKVKAGWKTGERDAYLQNNEQGQAQTPTRQRMTVGTPKDKNFGRADASNTWRKAA